MGKHDSIIPGSSKHVIPPVPMNIGGKSAGGISLACHPGKIAGGNLIRDLIYLSLHSITEQCYYLDPGSTLRIVRDDVI
jgi:hypothetical protein